MGGWAVRARVSASGLAMGQGGAVGRLPCVRLVRLLGSRPGAGGSWRTVMGQIPEWWKLPDWWKYFPSKWLLSDKVREMDHVAHSGYRLLVDHAYLVTPLPGILPDDDDKLRGWARFSSREWKSKKSVILANFAAHKGVSTARTWHHEFIKALFREFAHESWKRYASGKSAIGQRWKKKPGFELKIQPYSDPYQAYTIDLYQVSNKEITYLPQSSAPPGAADIAEGGEGVGPPEKIGAFLRHALHPRKGHDANGEGGK